MVMLSVTIQVVTCIVTGIAYVCDQVTRLMDEVKEGIKYIFQTSNELTLCVSAAGHGGTEAIMCNLLEPGEKVLVDVSGIWGQRANDMAARYGAVVTQIRAKPGDNLSLAEIEQEIAKHRPTLFFTVQGDSSTGVYQPVEGVGDICHKYNCLLAVDAVASLGSVPLYVDKWNIDAVYTGSQKVLSGPAGITPLSFSPRAQRKIFNRRTPVPVFYWDMKVLGDYWNCFGNPRMYHHTISSTLLYGLREALAMVVDEGLENIIARHRRCAEELYKGLNRLGMSMYVADERKRLPSVTTPLIPHGVNWMDLSSYAINRYSVEIRGGLGPTANKTLRIGLMGYNATSENVSRVLQILSEFFEMSLIKNKL